MYYLIILYIAFLFLQFTSVRENKNIQNVELHNFIKYNINNREKINKILRDKLVNYEKKLNKMDYDKWIEFIQKNEFVNIDNQIYSFFIFEKIPNEENYFIRASSNPKLINITWKDYYSNLKDAQAFSKYETEENLIDDMLQKGKVDILNNIDYFWSYKNTNQIIRKFSYFIHYKKGKKEGIIGIGYPIENKTSQDYAFFYSIKSYFFIICSLSTIIISITLNKINNNTIKPLIFLFLSNIYIYTFINRNQGEPSAEVEKYKTHTLTRSLLSVAYLYSSIIFLMGFFIGIEKIIFKETFLLFGFSVFFTVIALYVNTSYKKISDLTTDRINKQFNYNYTVCIILFSVFNIILYNLNNITKFVLKK